MTDGDPKAFGVDVQVQKDGDIEFHHVHIAGCEVAKSLSDQNLLPLGEHNSWHSRGLAGADMKLTLTLFLR